MNSNRPQLLADLGHQPQHAFTLLDLLAVIAILVLLASLLVPAMAQTQPNSHRFQCLNNLKQIQNATVMYAHDHSDLFPPNPDDPGDTIPGHHWLNNSMSFYNPIFVADETSSLITPYLSKNIRVFKCPADPRVGVYTGSDPSMVGKLIPATRSVSMSGAVGTVCDGFWGCGGHSGVPKHPVNGPWLDGAHANGCNGALKWSTFGKTSSFRTISPAMVFVLADENPTSINDAVLATDADPVNRRWVDYPASYHNGGAGFAFCDGHTEMHRWIGEGIKKGPSGGSAIITPADSVDFNWLAQHSSAKEQ